MPRRLTGALLSALVLMGCEGGAEAPRNVLLISIDTLRPDRLGCYGHTRPTSPSLDRLAGEGVVFEDASSPSPWTLPAHASLFTSLYPRHHGMKALDLRLPSELATLAEILVNHGFETAAVVNSHMLETRYGLHRGFESFEFVNPVGQDVGSSAVEEIASRWLRAERRRPFFLFLHFYSVHSDYDSLPEYEEQFVRSPGSRIDGSTEQLKRYREGVIAFDEKDRANLLDLYDAAIRQLDDGLGRIFAVLEERGLMEETLVVVTSDHGEEFLEHGDVLHGRTHYQEVVRVPLVVRGPGVPGAERIGTMVSLLDVAPTILSALGISPPDQMVGIDLSRLWSEPDAPVSERLLFSEADHNNVAHDVRRAVRDQHFSLQHDRSSGEWKLYDLASDPWEQVDVMAREPEVAARLRERLEDFMSEQAHAEPIAPLSKEERDQLRSLGYLD